MENIKEKIKKSIQVGLLSIFLISSLGAATVFAVSPTDFASDSGAQLVNCGQKGGKECTWADLIGLINTIINFLIWFSATIAVISFCYAGFLYLTAFGEMGKVEQAHGIFSKTIVGMLFVFLGWLIIATVLKVMGADPNIVKTIDFNSVETIQAK